MEQNPPHSPIQPLSFSYHPSAAEPSLHTTMGICCRLLCCVDLGNGHHFSQSFLCHLRFEVFTPSSSLDLNSPAPHNTPSVALCLPPDLTIHRLLQLSRRRIMRQHHRMRCRRGGSRGNATRPSSLPPSVSTSPFASPPLSPSNYLFLGQYLDTRSGQGRMGTNEVRHLGGLAQHTSTTASSQQAQFQFRYSMDRLLIIATVTIDFREFTDSCFEPKLSPEINQDPPKLNIFQGEPSSSHPLRDMGNPSSSQKQNLGGEATRKDKGIQMEDTTGGRHAEDTGLEEYG